MESSMLKVDGALLYCELRGEGPPFLMISGAGGDAGYYARVADVLSDAFTVITYDRRANSRSTGARDQSLQLSQQAEDAKTIIDRLAGGDAFVFGNSAGAIIGLELASRHPESVRALIAHEPPALKTLPESDPCRDFFDRIGAIFKEAGLHAAMEKFLSTHRGDSLQAWPQDLAQRVLGNFDYFFRCEWASLGQFVPNFEALRSVHLPIVLGAGSEDRGLYYARPSIEIAKRIDATWVEFPGVHLEFVKRPEIFAAALRPLLTQLHDRIGGGAAPWNSKTPVLLGEL
ncbi:alpha/beta fold hydrolase [Burkholderia glumae]|uniref:alpha/beta fold hydrolase n=2 Tax=Burkholderia glumae TaxID=337 RepID=UPI003B9BDE18